MNLVHKLCAISCLFGLAGAVTACGSDDDKGSGGGADGCKQVCDKQAAAKCPSAIQISTDDCKQLCDGLAQTSAACKDALKVESDCQLAQADICSDTGCDTQDQAVGTACLK